MKNYKESFSIKLKILRNTYGLSLAELAKILNMNTRGSLYDWENKRSFPSMENLIFLTNFFGVSLEWLLGRSSDIYTENSIYLGEIALYTEIDDDNINGREVGECYRADFLKAIEHISGKEYLDLDGLNVTNYSSRIEYYSLPIRANLLVLLRLVPLGDLYWAYHIICDKYSQNKRDILTSTKEYLRSAIGIKAEKYKAPGKKARERAINLVKLLMPSEMDADSKMPIYDVEAVCHQLEQGTNS
ncbi:MAG: helix-turn-helix domain-containing protein [Megasphaera sp.]|uniref:helix-turn-helix domain-containing protein n=1 Tax=Megasphaera sp. TaxID=2023260 RepID=UPI003F0DFE89